ncbi:MAG: SPOR domain-containing protein [Pseudomonadota bacterium]
MSMRNEAGFGDDDRLPWLETVEEDYREGPSLWRILLLIVLAVAVLGAVAFGVWWYQKQQGLSGNGALINAQEGDYKVKPDDEDAMNVEGEGGAVFPTSEGAATNASVNVNAQTEAPVEGKTVAQPTPGAGEAKGAVAVPASGGALKAQAPGVAPAAPAATANAGSGSLIQLGAFPDQQGADAAWGRLSKRFAYLSPLGKSVEKGDKNGTTVFRLRVNAGSNGQAREICGKLKAAGENCYVAN